MMHARLTVGTILAKFTIGKIFAQFVGNVITVQETLVARKMLLVKDEIYLPIGKMQLTIEEVHALLWTKYN